MLSGKYRQGRPLPPAFPLCFAKTTEETTVPVRPTAPRMNRVTRVMTLTAVLVVTVLASIPPATARSLTKAGKKTGTKKTTVKKDGATPKPGSPCSTKAANYPGTALDCVDVPGSGLQWRIRGTLRNPFRLGEATEVWSIEGSRFRMTLTDWNPAVTVPPGPYATDLSARNTVLSAYRYRVTLLQSGPGARNLAADAAATTQFAVTANAQGPLHGTQTALPACAGGYDNSLVFGPQADTKPGRDTLQVADSGTVGSCEEAPAGANIVIENYDKDTANRVIVYTYFTGTPR